MSGNISPVAREVGPLIVITVDKSSSETLTEGLLTK
jgi:hypothetical protein